MSDLAELADFIVGSKPPASPFVDAILEQQNVSEGLPRQEEANSSPVSSGAEPIPPISSPSPTEAAGETFDPKIHAVDAAGNPKKRLDGGFAKKRGRKAGDVSSPASVPTEDLTYSNAAISTVQLIIVMGYTIGGEEWKPEPHEVLAMNMAWTEYYKTTGIKSMPPWVGVAVATGAYAMPRMHKPVTKSRIGGLLAWFRPATYKVMKWLKLSS